MRAALIWTGLALALALPIVLAAQSPFLQWRDPIYIAGGFAGIIGLALMLVQPLLVTRALPGLRPRIARRVHRWIGAGLVLCVLAHIVGLWITSPPDVVDVLLFRSPTPFGVWGAVAMWAVFAAAGVAVLRARLSPKLWRWGHVAATAGAVLGTILHALLIEGAMEIVSKAVLCALVLAAFVAAARGVLRRQGAR